MRREHNETFKHNCLSSLTSQVENVVKIAIKIYDAESYWTYD